MSNFEDFEDGDLNTPTAKDLQECYGSKYLSAPDFGNKKVRDRIKKVRKEAMRQQDGKPERPKFVIYFANLDKPMVLNATNKITLVDALGGDPADWIGAEVGIFAEDTMFAGKPVKGLRLRVLSKPKSAPKPAPAPKPAAEETWDAEDPGNQGEDADFTEAAE